MLIIVPEDADPLVEHLCLHEPVEKLRSLTKLLQAHADARHIVVIPPTICRIIEECTRFSEEQRALAKKIRSKFSELSQLQRILPVYGQICAEGVAPIFTLNCWHIPLGWIARYGLSQTHLVCEDLYDCDIGHEAARDFLHTNELARLDLSLDHTAGGGGNTHRVFRTEAVEYQKISLCVVDSDRSNPSKGAPIGVTASNCRDVTGPGIYELVICNGRELENHLPVKLIDQLRPVWHGERPSVKHTALNANHPHLWLFADFKTGLRRREVEGMTGEDGHFWKTCANSLPHSMQFCCSGGCKAKKEDACRQVVVEPLGRTLLKDAVAYLKDDRRRLAPKRSTEYLPSPNDSFWKDLGRKVAAYGVAMKVNPGM